ncbi:protection of telomeres protein 1 isoform X1 [Nothobranchius furzeri]|uniref:protection of telomeres protein 1 isoform X1 n=1 Tax=Nothobranchius furzeri TaxID=105023 RepID=UPI003904A8C2
MPFGLTNAPAVFQSLVKSVLGDYLNKFVTVYLDNILIFSSSEEQHVKHVRSVLQCLLEKCLYVKAEKCVFHVLTVTFLGFIIESGRLKADPEKVHAITEWPTLMSRKQLQRFLGFTSFYRRFIRNYSWTAAPLTNLTSINRPFVWSPEAEAAFQTLKRRFTNAPVLHRPDPQCQFTLEVDASDTGVATVLSQISYRPGPKNTKPDALSRQCAQDQEVEPSTILPRHVWWVESHGRSGIRCWRHLRLTQVQAKWFNGSMTLSSNVGFSVVTFDGAVGGAVEPRSSRKFFSFDEHDRRRVEELRSWAVSQDVCSTVSAAVPLSGVQPKVYFDLTCQLLAKAPIDTTCMLLRVWDGTKCPYTQSDVTIDPDTIEGPASFSGTKKSFIANILVFDNHVVCAKQLKIGAFLRIYNLRAVCESVKEPGLLRMDTDHLVFQLNGGTSFGKGIRVLPESSPDVQKLKRSFESFSEDEPSDSEMLEIWSTPPEFLNDGAVETRTERSCSHQIQPMTLSQLKQSQPEGEYHVRAQLRSYQPHRLHQSLKLFCSNCSSMQEIPNEEVLSGIFSAAFQDSTPCRHPPWILSGHVSLPEDVAQSPKKSMDVLASSRLLKKENPKEFIFLQGFSLEETCMLAAHYENIVPLTSSGGDLDLLDLSAPFLFRGKKRYYGCKRCSEASLRNMKAVGAVVDEKFLAEDLGIQLLQYVLLMRLKLQDSTDTLDVFLWKDAEKFFGVSAEDVSATEEAQERVQKVMDLLCPPEDSQDQRPWLDLCLMAYAVEDEPGQSQTCYQIINTTIITPSTTQSGPD